MRKSIVTVLAAVAASLAAPAAAEEFATASVTVSYRDLDLTNAAGVATLERRLKEAVRKVCARVEPRYLRGQAAWEECKAKSLADAMEQLAAVVPAENLALAGSSEN